MHIAGTLIAWALFIAFVVVVIGVISAGGMLLAGLFRLATSSPKSLPHDQGE